MVQKETSNGGEVYFRLVGIHDLTRMAQLHMTIGSKDVLIATTDMAFLIEESARKATQVILVMNDPNTTIPPMCHYDVVVDDLAQALREVSRSGTYPFEIEEVIVLTRVASGLYGAARRHTWCRCIDVV